jgi:hypothetical protein
MRVIVWISLLLAVVANVLGSLDDPDLWWHIVIGRWIIAHRDVPVVDHWTLFGYGQPWRAYSWLIEIVFATVDRYFSITGLMVLKVGTVALLAGVAQWVLISMSGSLGFGSLLAIFYTASLYSHLTLRPQAFIWILFFIVMYLAERIAREGFNRSRGIGLFLVMALWANIHFSAVLALLLIFLWIVQRQGSRIALSSCSVAFLGTLMTPYMGGEWVMLAKTSSHPFQFNAISEFRPATILQFSTVFPVLAIAVACAGLLRKPSIISFSIWTLGAIFLVAGLAIIKFLPFFMVIACGMLALIWRALAGDSHFKLFEGIRRLIQLIESMPREGLSFLLLCYFLVQVVAAVRTPLHPLITPVAALDVIISKQLPLPLLNGFGHGGYVAYRFSDERGELEHRPSIDGRTNLISPDLWKMHMAALEGRDGWQRYIDAVKPGTILWKAESPLVQILRNNSEWCHIVLNGDYSDGDAIFIKREALSRFQGIFSAENCPVL